MYKQIVLYCQQNKLAWTVFFKVIQASGNFNLEGYWTPFTYSFIIWINQSRSPFKLLAVHLRKQFTEQHKVTVAYSTIQRLQFLRKDHEKQLGNSRPYDYIRPESLKENICIVDKRTGIEYEVICQKINVAALWQHCSSTELQNKGK